MAQQIKKKFIGADQIDGEKILLEDGQTLRKIVSGVEIDALEDVLNAGKSYSDQKISELVDSAPEVLNTLKELSDALGGDENFAATVAGQIGAVDSKVDQEISDRQSAVSAEEAARIAEDLTFMKLDGSRPMEADLGMGGFKISSVGDGVNANDVVNKGQLNGVESGLQSQIDTLSSNQSSSSTELQSAIDAEKARIDQEIIDRASGDQNLQAQIDSIVSNTDPAALDSLTEIVSAFQAADSNLNTTITNLSTSSASAIAAEQARAEGVEAQLQSDLDSEVATRTAEVSALDGRVTENEQDIVALESQMLTAQSDILSNSSAISAEETRALAAEGALSGRLDVLEAKTFGKEKIVVGAELSFVELSREVDFESLVVFVGRLGMHKDEDFTVSNVGGKTRLTWIGSLATMGSEEIETGDNVFVTYYY